MIYLLLQVNDTAVGQDELPQWLIATISIVLIVVVIYLSLKFSGSEKKKSRYEKRVTQNRDEQKDKELFLRDD